MYCYSCFVHPLVYLLYPVVFLFCFLGFFSFYEDGRFAHFGFHDSTKRRAKNKRRFVSFKTVLSCARPHPEVVCHTAELSARQRIASLVPRRFPAAHYCRTETQSDEGYGIPLGTQARLSPFRILRSKARF